MHYSEQVNQMTFFDEVVEEITPETVVKTTPDISEIVDKIIAQKPPENETGDDRDPEFANAVRNHGLITMDVGQKNLWYFDGDENLLPADKLEELKHLKGDALTQAKKKILNDEVKEKYKISIARSMDKFLQLPSRYPKHGFAMEHAHFVAQQNKSVSQSFVPAIKQEFIDNCEKYGCVLRNAPESQTPKIIEREGFPKNDFLDALSLHRHINKNLSTLTLKKPPFTDEFTKRQLDAFEFKAETNLIANIYRRETRQEQVNCLMDLQYEELWPYFIERADFVDHLGDGNDYRDLVFDALGVKPLPPDQYKVYRNECRNRGMKEGDILSPAYHLQKYNDKINNKTYIKGDLHRSNVLSNTLVPSILICFLGAQAHSEDIRASSTLTARVRLVGTSYPNLPDRLMSWMWAKQYHFRYSPYHLKGGVVRSNLKYWCEKSYLKNLQKDFETSKKPEYNEKGEVTNYILGDKKGSAFDSKMGKWSLEQEDVNREWRRVYSHKVVKLLFFAIRKFVTERYRSQIEEAGIEI